MTETCIVAARRTPQGRFLGAFRNVTAVELALRAGAAVLEGIDRREIDEVIVGNVLSAGQGMNIARQIGIKLGLPVAVPAYTVNMMCASGMQAVRLADRAIRAGEARAVLCGGTESMSNAPHLLPRSRGGFPLGDAVLVDSLLRDGLVDSFDDRHMGVTAEQLARTYQLSREHQDDFALRSQARWIEAHRGGVFAPELVPLEELAEDEHPRPETTRASLAGLRPAFDNDGTVTAGNASGINDGAALLLLADREFALRKGWPILAVLAGSAAVGCTPGEMGLGPVHATRQLCEQLGVDPSHFDQIELNEAFAAQALACLRELELDHPRLNPHGGAIALGHPIGASGARLLTHLAHQISQGHSRTALATLCVGGGMGIAVALREA
jgi:acetyl-CoA C-acetyltransferase